MIVEILELLPADVVRFAAPWGSLTASWKGSSAAVVHERWVVEADTARPYDWNEVETDIQGEPGLRSSRELQTRVTGTVIDLDENGILTIRYGDYLMMVEVSNPPEMVPTGTSVALTIDDLQLWPYDRP